MGIKGVRIIKVVEMVSVVKIKDFEDAAYEELDDDLFLRSMYVQLLNLEIMHNPKM